MHGSRPSLEEIEQLDDADVIEERASLLSAAQNARNVAMLTGTHGVVAAPLSRASVRVPAARELVPEGTALEDGEARALPAVLRARVAALGDGDAVTVCRARLELALAVLDAGQEDEARAIVASAAAEPPRAAAAAALHRALLAGRARIPDQLALVDQLLEAASSDAVRADMLAERARLLEAQAGPSADSIEAWRQALALARDHAGALYGIESALDRTAAWPELAEHFRRLAELAGAGELAAWLNVERALLLERRLSDDDGARAALSAALVLSPGVGPVRAACVDFAARKREDALLAALLEGEAAIESDAARAARLELDAALAVRRAGGETARAIKLLEHAHGRAPTSALVDARVAHELARLHEAEGRHADALRVRKAALRSIDDPREELFALRVVATTAERAGDLDEAILALERARVLEVDDPTLLADLDRVLVAAGRHEQRAVLWMREAATVDEPSRKGRALLRAAEASRAAGRDTEALRHLASAWVAAPNAPGIYDALVERLAPAGERAAVAARVALYEQAVRSADDPDRRVYWREKIAWLWDDVAGDAERAAAAYEDVLAIEPGRLSAIVGLASSATRAGDDARLARALLAEADVTADGTRRAQIRLRGAEVLSTHDPERALALAEELTSDDRVAARARELVTRLHAAAGRWDRVARTLADRRQAGESGASRVALALAEVDVLLGRLSAPERALRTLEEARRDAPGDALLAHATIAVLEALGDAAKMRAELERLAESATTPRARAALFLRAAEIEEVEPEGDERAVRLYQRALEAVPDELLFADRLSRLGARVSAVVDVTSGDVVSPLSRAVRSLEAGGTTDPAAAEPLLASGARDWASLRIIERLARRAGSAPQLANALALQAEVGEGVAASRALAGVASLVAWTLPESGEVEPWDRLLVLGSHDVTVLDALWRRAAARVRAGDRRAAELASQAWERRLAGAADVTERLVARLELARLARRRGAPEPAVLHCREALALDPSSVTAAVLLGEVASELGDRPAAILAARSLAEVVVDGVARAALLRDAADLAVAEGDPRTAAALLERALEADPDGVLVAARLAQVLGDLGEWEALSRALRRALPRARTVEAVVPMASELAEVARTRLRAPLLAIEALERSRDVSPEHVPTLFLLAELYIGERAWQQALDALSGVVAHASEPAEKLVAHAGRASILARVLARSAEAERELRAALALDPHDPRALRGLLDLDVTLAPAERADFLSRLVVSEPRPAERMRALLEVAALRKALGDAQGFEGALVEAAAISPDAATLDRVRESTRDDPEAFARIVGRAVARARESGLAQSPAWMARLGQIEADVLGRHEDAIEHLRDALEADPSRVDLRPVLARVLVATARNAEAADALTGLLEAPTGAAHLDAPTLRLLEVALTGAGKGAEARVARELRALSGAMDARERSMLDAGQAGWSAEPDALGRAALRAFVMVPEAGRHPVWDVAPIALELGAKLGRIGLADVGASTRDRVKPRAAHPLRAAFDRVARAFGTPQVELAVSDHAAVAALAVEDAPWVVLPASLVDAPDASVRATLARLLARVALGVPWLEAFEPDEVVGMIGAVGRQVAPSFLSGAGAKVEAFVDDYELRARRAIDRKRRRALEELVPALEGAPAVTGASLASAVARAAARASFLASGDLRAALGANIGGFGVALGLAQVLESPEGRDLTIFALSREATAMRRGLGTLSA